MWTSSGPSADADPSFADPSFAVVSPSSTSGWDASASTRASGLEPLAVSAGASSVSMGASGSSGNASPASLRVLVAEDEQQKPLRRDLALALLAAARVAGGEPASATEPAIAAV